MLKETEKEFKYSVSYEMFQALMSKCNEEYQFFKCKLQANYYYDTDDNLLNKSRVTVRIRQQEGDMKLQIKKHNENKDGLFISDEYSEKIEILPAVLKIADFYETLNLKGVLVTERKIFLFGKNSSICFDYNMYLGICDYEVEIEVDEADKDKALILIECLGLTRTLIITKSERFFKRLKAMKD